MVDDMAKFTRLELSYKHLQRAAQFLREHLTAIASDGDPDDELDNITASEMDAYNRMLLILDNLNPERPEWPKKEGKCQVVDINVYRKEKVDAVCKGG